MEQMRLLVVDGHPVICEGLSVLLRNYDGIRVTGTANDGEEGLMQLRRLAPDGVVLDLNLPRLGGVETISLYLQEKPDLNIVIFSGHKEESMVFQALQAGARAYVYKGAPVSALVSALREVQRGGYWLSTELTPSIVKRYLNHEGRETDQFAEYNALTSREKQVFMLLAKGKSPREVGVALFISIKTVSKHQTSIKSKLKLKNTAEIALYALRLGLVSNCDL